MLEANEVLDIDTCAYYHTDFYGYGHPQNPNFIYQIKNDRNSFARWYVVNAARKLCRIFLHDFSIISDEASRSPLTVCAVPRAKVNARYNEEQLFFRKVVSFCATKMSDMKDGTRFIDRVVDTKTTHLRKPQQGFINNGSCPYRGIAKDTCYFSPELKGRDILLVDDIYTKGVNIDEDMVQALYDHGVNSVIFYAFGRTVRKYK